MDLFAAMNAATGEVVHDTRKRHAGTDVSAFFELIDAHVPAGQELHVILDHLSAHKSDRCATGSMTPNGAVGISISPRLGISPSGGRWS